MMLLISAGLLAAIALMGTAMLRGLSVDPDAFPPGAAAAFRLLQGMTAVFLIAFALFGLQLNFAVRGRSMELLVTAVFLAGACFVLIVVELLRNLAQDRPGERPAAGGARRGNLRWWAACVFAAGSVLALGAGRWNHQRNKEDALKVFRVEAARAEAMLRSGLAAHAHIFSLLDSLHRIKPALSASDFREFVRQIIAESPFIRTIQWVPPGADAIAGVDLPAERLAPLLAEAKDSGLMTVSEPFPLSGTEGGPTAFLMVLPARSGAAFKGHFVGLYRIEDMVDELVGSKLPRGMALAVYSGETINPETRIYGAAPRPGAPRELSALPVTGRTWTAVWSRPDGLGVSAETSVALAGLITALSGLFSAMLLIAGTRERKREEEIRDRFFGISPDLHCIAGFDGFFKQLSPSWTRTLGFPLSRLVERPLIEFVHPDDAAATIAEREKIKRGGTTVHFTNRYICADGSYRWFQWVAVPVPAEGLIYASARDVTDEKKNLLDLENLNKALDRSAIVMGTTLGGEITYVNDLFTEVTGFSREELIGKTPRVLNSGHHPKEFFKGLWDTVKRGEVWKGEIRNRTKDGRFFWVDSTITPMLGPEGGPESFFAIFHVVTERKELELGLARARDAALEHARAKSEFLANMSHEIRTPMNGILGMTTILLNSDLNAEQRDYAETAQKSAESLLAILNDVLDFSKIESGKMTIKEISFDLRRAVAGVIRLLGPLASARRIELISAVDPGVPVLVVGDPIRLRQVLMNIVGNAIKFTTEGHVILRVLPSPAGGDATLFSVADTGIGIDAGTRKRLFQPFSQADASDTRAYGGTGLGLAISQRIVSDMGGTISVESEPGIGSTFSFFLRLPRDPAAAEAPAPAGSELLRGLKGRVFDDDPATREVVEAQLRAWGIELASGGELGLAVVDLDSPGPAGEDFLKGLETGRSSKGPAVLAVSFPGPVGRSRAAKAGAGGYASKPLTESTLFNSLVDLFASPAPVPREPPSGAGPAARSARRILIAEDNTVNRKVMGTMLKKLGFAAESADNGEAVLDAFRTERFDLILMDCQMPVMDGYEAARRIREIEEERGTHRVPIIAVTADVLSGAKQRALDSGMDDYISKPVKLADLKAKISAWIPSLAAAEPVPEDADPPSVEPPVVDEGVVDGLRDLAEGSEGGFLEDLFDTFLENAAASAAEIERSARDGDAAALARAAHALRGSSASVGALRLSGLCGRIEARAREGRLDPAREHAAGLPAELAAAREGLLRVAGS